MQTFSHLSPRHDTLTLMIHSLDGSCAISTAWIIPPAGRRVIISRSRFGSNCQSSLCFIVIYPLLQIRICLSSFLLQGQPGLSSLALQPLYNHYACTQLYSGTKKGRPTCREKV